jgi:hypothetical protein
MVKHLKIAISITLGATILAGCASGPTASEGSLSPISPSPSSSAGEQGSSELNVEFRKIAKVSCDKAYEEGVTERSDVSADRLVLLPVSYLYNDFFAAVVNDEGGVEPIWSTEIFSVCIDYINFLMAEESNSEYEITVSGDLAGGTLRTEYQVDDFGTIVSDYVIEDGLFVEVRTKSPETESVTLVEYGTPSEADIEAFREAIDLFLSGE